MPSIQSNHESSNEKKVREGIVSQKKYHESPNEKKIKELKKEFENECRAFTRHENGKIKKTTQTRKLNDDMCITWMKLMTEEEKHSARVFEGYLLYKEKEEKKKNKL